MTDEWKTLVDRVTTLMKDHARPFTTPLLHEPTGKDTVYGSGTYVTNGNSAPAVVTCEHVLRLQPQKHWPEATIDPLILSGRIFADRDPKDAAILKMYQADWEMFQGAQAVPIGRFAATHHTVESEILFFYGLAGENARSVFEYSRLSTGYCTQEKRGTGDSENFEMFWEPEHTEISSDTLAPARQEIKFENPGGFSGALVWNTRFVESGCDFNRWSPADARVTGLVRRWDPGTKTLLAWRAEHLLAWLASAMSAP